MRHAHGSGRWYPADGTELRQVVEACLDEAVVPAVEGCLVGALAPHAGYPYSGGVAGHTFRAIKDDAAAGNKPDVVVVLGLAHAMGFQGVSLMDGDALTTPLGEAVLDSDTGAFLARQSERIVVDYRPHDVGFRGAEHSAENQIPFLQVALPGVPLVIGLMGDHEAATLDAVVAALGVLAKEKQVLVVSSTDLLHADDYDLVTRTDAVTLEKIATMDHAWLAQTWGVHNQVCCGVGPVLAAMRFAEARGVEQATVLTYQNSGDVMPLARGGYTVGYGAVVFAA